MGLALGFLLREPELCGFGGVRLAAFGGVR